MEKIIWSGTDHKACNPSYSGGRDQVDHNLKPEWANKMARPYLDPITKKKKKKLVFLLMVRI
jgi:hypothetical protein